MRRVSFYVAASLDGFIARRDGALDWLPQPTAAEDYGYAKFMQRVDTLVMGRKTYAVTRSFGEWPYADRRTLVFSRTRSADLARGVEWRTGDVAAAVGALRQGEGRDIWLVGGGVIAQACLQAGVVDEIILTTIPVLLGEGLPLFLPRANGTRLALRESRAFPDGLVQTTYEVVG